MNSENTLETAPQSQHASRSRPLWLQLGFYSRPNRSDGTQSDTTIATSPTVFFLECLGTLSPRVEALAWPRSWAVWKASCVSCRVSNKKSSTQEHEGQEWDRETGGRCPVKENAQQRKRNVWVWIHVCKGRDRWSSLEGGGLFYIDVYTFITLWGSQAAKEWEPQIYFGSSNVNCTKKAFERVE